MEGEDFVDLSIPNINLTEASNAAYDNIVPQTAVDTPNKQQGGQLDSNWLSILEDIKDIREQLSQSDIYTPEDNNDTTNDAPEADLVLGPVPAVDFRDIIASVPPRPICDKLLSEYFCAPFMLRRFLVHWSIIDANFLEAIVHTIKFQNEVRCPVLSFPYALWLTNSLVWEILARSK